MPSTPERPERRIIACQECHKRKVKCSGSGPPCIACAEGRHECVYPVRDKKTKVGQKYLDRILKENHRLSAIVSALNTPGATPPADVGGNGSQLEPRADNADRNPVLEERPWFMSFEAVDLPIHIGEAADAAFATRLRQAASSKGVTHLPRVQYMKDDALRSLSETPVEWPSPARVRFLVDVALKAVCKTWHIVRRSVVAKEVQTVIDNPKTCHWLTACRIWALMAVGEAASSRSLLPEGFPGARFWARAMQLVHMPSERPRLDLVEVYVLLSYYASTVNRRHTAILLASHSVRLCIILGLHIDISETQLKDAALREHRCRLFWTAYRFDRLWASKIGWPSSIPDDSIEIGLPSDNALLPFASTSDFEDASYIIMSVKLARMLNHAVNTLYVRKRQPTSFSERVQVAVRALREWADGLPEHLKLSSEDTPTFIESHVVYLHLAFNQAVVVTTRPILLHLLRQRKPRQQSAEGTSTQPPLSESALALTAACIRCARQSMGLLKQSWADGRFPTFDYFHMQFLFSSATILALSAILQGTGWVNDHEDFLLAYSFLQQLERNGNYGAKEFCTHTEALTAVLKENLDTVPPGQIPIGVPSSSSLPQPLVHESMLRQEPVPNPPLQDFLNHAEIDLDFMDTGGQWIDWQDVFWPDTELPSSSM